MKTLRHQGGRNLDRVGARVADGRRIQATANIPGPVVIEFNAETVRISHEDAVPSLALHPAIDRDIRFLELPFAGDELTFAFHLESEVVQTLRQIAVGTQ